MPAIMILGAMRAQQGIGGTGNPIGAGIIAVICLSVITIGGPNVEGKLERRLRDEVCLMVCIGYLGEMIVGSNLEHG